MWTHRDYFPVNDAITAEIFLRYLWNGWNPLAFFDWYANEHRPAFPMAILALDHLLTGTVGPISTAAMYACALLLSLSFFFVERARRIDPRHFMFAAASLVIFFWPGHWENFVWSSQIQIFLAVTSGVGALVLLIRTPADSQISLSRIIAISALLFIGCFSFAIGFVFAAAALVISYCRFGWSKLLAAIALVLLSGVSIYAAVFWGRDQFGYTAGNIFEPRRFFLFVLRYVGGPLTVAIEKTFALGGIHLSQAVRLRLAAGIGAGAAIYAGWVTFTVLRMVFADRRQSITPYAWLAFGLSWFVFGNAFVTAMGRSFSPVNYPLDVPRYYVGIVIFWVGLLAHLILDKRRPFVVVAPVVAGVMLIFSLSGYTYRDDIREHAAANRRAGVAAMSHVSDAWPMFWLPDLLPDLYARYEADHALVFSEEWARTFSKKLPAHRKDGACEGQVLKAAPITAAGNSYQLSGSFTEPLSAEWLIVSQNDVVKGFGAAQRLSAATPEMQWIAYARDAALPLAVDVVLATGELCRLGSIALVENPPAPTYRQPYRTDFDAALSAPDSVDLKCPPDSERVRWVDGRLLCMPMRDAGITRSP
jgi:hypothetical protein